MRMFDADVLRADPSANRWGLFAAAEVDPAAQVNVCRLVN